MTPFYCHYVIDIIIINAHIHLPYSKIRFCTVWHSVRCVSGFTVMKIFDNVLYWEKKLNAFLSVNHSTELFIITVIRSCRSQIFFKIGFLKNFAIFTGKHLCWSLFSLCFPVNIPDFLKTTFFIEHARWLLHIIMIIFTFQALLLDISKGLVCLLGFGQCCCKLKSLL